MNEIKKAIIIILVLIITINFNNYNVYANNINDLDKNKKDIQNKVKNAKNSLLNTKGQKESALKQIEILDKNLYKVEEELESVQNKLLENKKELEEITKELEKAQNKRKLQYETLKTRVRVMYEYGDMGYLQVILNSKGFTDFFRRVEYMNYIMEYDKNLFDNYKETEAVVKVKLDIINKIKQNLQKLEEDVKVKKIQAQKEINKKQELIKNLRNKESSLNEQIKDLKRADEEVTNLIRNLQSVQSGGDNKVYPNGNGQLGSPVPKYANSPYNDVYGYRVNPISGKNELHSGLDLKARYGDNIVAAEDGTVIYANTRGGYGKTVIIDHGEGMTTLYGHNSKLVVKKGQKVKRGQVIAKAGSTGYSTGVHAHFEVRLNGKHTDPAPYLK